ncbi:hypothetical protein N431DRAFT_515409 [Stipitochalara longipes BDJ]|nr:hypothetical protein N431DRAFT_515409 [Stipitochalara longipes BDJ]
MKRPPIFRQICSFPLISKAGNQKTWEYTTDELQAVLAEVFPQFKTLAEELQDLIWTCALMQPTIVECIYRSDLKRFWALASKKAIRDTDTATLDPALHLVRPIYMMPCITDKDWEQKLAKEWEYGWQPEWGPRRKNKKQVRFLPAEPIYICPQDIVYVPEIHNMDVDSFINKKSSYIIENLAIHSGTALELNKASFWALLGASPTGKLIRGLPNLKTLHIVEGEYTGAKLIINKVGKYKLSLAEIKEGEDTGIKYSSGAVRRKIQHPWNSGIVESIRKVFMEKILIEDAVERYKKYNPGCTWQIPELHFHELKRKSIEQ